MIRIFSIIMLSLFLISCNKPDPNPELKDPIYSDLNALLASTNQSIEAEKKTLEGHQQALKDVVPQTGQIKYAQKRVFESMDKISKMEQEAKYLELKIVARKKQAKQSYAQAFAKDEPWPSPVEWSSYQTEKKLRAAKRNWDSRDRIKDFGLGNEKTPGSAAEGSHH